MAPGDPWIASIRRQTSMALDTYPLGYNRFIGERFPNNLRIGGVHE